MPIIYLLIAPNGHKYVGKTIYTFEERWQKHWYDYKKSRRCIAQGKPWRGCRALYNAFAKYNMANFEYDILHEGDFDPEQLKQLETDAIASENTLHPNGYNLTTGGECGGHSEETRAIMRVAIKAGIHENITSYRDHADELEGLPPHVVYFKKGEMRGYRITRHPRCENKRFASKTKSLEDLKQEVLRFMADLEASDTIHQSNQKKKRALGIPAGIRSDGRNGYAVDVQIKNKWYGKSFTNGTPEMNLANAKQHLEDIKKTI